MFRKLLLLLFCFQSFIGFSQESGGVGTYFSKGAQFMGQNKDSTYFYFQKTIEEADKSNQINYLLSGYVYLIYANGLYFDLENFKKNLDHFGTVLSCDPRMENVPYLSVYERKYLTAKGNYYYKSGNYKEAKQYFLKIYKLLAAVPEENMDQDAIVSMGSTLSFLAAIYKSNGKYSLANEYYDTTLRFLKEHQKQIPNWKSRTALTHLSMAVLFQKEKKYKTAERFIREALAFYETGEGGFGHNNSLISGFHLLVENYLSQHEPDNALIALDEIVQKQLIDPGNLRFLKIQYKYRAQANAQKGNYTTALQWYRKALKTNEKYYGTSRHADIALLYSKIGKLFADQQRFEESLMAHQKALISISMGFQGEEFSKNPDPADAISKLVLIKVLRGKLNALSTAYQASDQLEYLKTANETSKNIVATLEALKPEFESKVDMQFLLEETFPAFDQMMETAFLLHEKTGDQQYLEDAFYFSEKSKAVLLLSAVQKTGATQFAGIPDSVLERERHYRATINHLEKQRFKKPNEKALADKLFDLKNEYYSFQNMVEEKYPKYHRLKYKTQVATLPEIQALLGPKETMLDYYLAENKLYYFVIDRKNIRLKRIPFSENAVQRILQLQKHFSSPQVTKINELKTLSHQVYEELMPPMDASISELIVLRSGVLNYIPFGALYNKKENKYLIEDYAVSYANSATLYKEYAVQKEQLDPQILAFAPSFSGEEAPEEVRSILGQLLYNKKEVKLISDYFDGKILLNEEATLNAFENNAENYGILHLATHAIINDKFPDYSYLAFAPKDSIADLLYIQDLYNYDLTADLVVLSACETGIGKLQKGAGMLSLARGFNYAGASSLVTTQWKIDDKSSSLLMKNFYKNLAKGEAKNVALKNAKINYLKTTDDAMQRHPYYWAGFVLTGNTYPIVETNLPNHWIWLGMTMVLITLILIGKKYLGKRSKYGRGPGNV